eukprot:6966691-Prymnesium_polylepis.1
MPQHGTDKISCATRGQLGARALDRAADGVEVGRAAIELLEQAAALGARCLPCGCIARKLDSGRSEALAALRHAAAPWFVGVRVHTLCADRRGHHGQPVPPRVDDLSLYARTIPHGRQQHARLAEHVEAPGKSADVEAVCGPMELLHICRRIRTVDPQLRVGKRRTDPWPDVG